MWKNEPHEQSAVKALAVTNKMVLTGVGVKTHSLLLLILSGDLSYVDLETYSFAFIQCISRDLKSLIKIVNFI